MSLAPKVLKGKSSRQKHLPWTCNKYFSSVLGTQIWSPGHCTRAGSRSRWGNLPSVGCSCRLWASWTSPDWGKWLRRNQGWVQVAGWAPPRWWRPQSRGCNHCGQKIIIIFISGGVDGLTDSITIKKFHTGLLKFFKISRKHIYTKLLIDPLLGLWCAKWSWVCVPSYVLCRNSSTHLWPSACVGWEPLISIHNPTNYTAVCI